jgi:hypothetical protein
MSPAQRETRRSGEATGLTDSATTPTKPKSSGQAGQVLAMLLEAPAVCSTTFLERYIPRAAAVIHKLRKQGYVIVTQECTRGHRHHNRQVEYVLEALPSRLPGIGGSE